MGLPATAGTSVAQGQFLNAATEREPVAVLGAGTARLLGIDRITPGLRIWVGGQWFYVTGILNRAVLAPELDSAVLIGFPAAEKYLNFDGHPSQIYLRTGNTQAIITRVDRLLGYQANPESPNQVDVSQPSSALTAQADAKGALDTLFLGLGAIALLVGAIGVANIMVISVLERRQEIGLRRALGATRGQIRIQFLAEADPAVPDRRCGWSSYRRSGDRDLRPESRRAAGDPGASLGRRAHRGRSYRSTGRPAARHSRRPAVADPGLVEPMSRDRQRRWPGRSGRRR